MTMTDFIEVSTSAGVNQIKIPADEKPSELQIAYLVGSGIFEQVKYIDGNGRTRLYMAGPDAFDYARMMVRLNILAGKAINS